jgi:hypothetical protein
VSAIPLDVHGEGRAVDRADAAEDTAAPIGHRDISSAGPDHAIAEAFAGISAQRHAQEASAIGWPSRGKAAHDALVDGVAAELDDVDPELGVKHGMEAPLYS